MNTLAKYLPLGLLFTACGSLRETGQIRDDVYDIPDRTAMASVSSAPAEGTTPSPSQDDYYDPGEARDAGVYRDYYDMTYNDPYYYNTGRFGFGASVNSWGPGMGMGMSYGWPTSWGSMSIGYGMGYGYGGYNPYWGNSWMSGYGYGDPWGYYGYGNYGYGYGGYGYGAGYGWSPYRSPWGGCYGCYEPVGYNSVVYGHRPSMTGSSASTGTARPSVRSYRNPAGLIQSPAMSARPSMSRQQGRVDMPSNNGRNGNTTFSRPSRNQQPSRETRPSRSNWNFGGGDAPSRSGGGDSSPSRSGGGGGGGGRTTSPRPR